MFGIFAASFVVMLAVDFMKIYIDFTITQRRYRVLIALQFVHLLVLVDMFVLTYMRYNHNGRACVCTEKDACMGLISKAVNVFLIVLYVIVGMAVFGGCCLGCLLFYLKRKWEREVAQDQLSADGSQRNEQYKYTQSASTDPNQMLSFSRSAPDLNSNEEATRLSQP